MYYGYSESPLAGEDRIASHPVAGRLLRRIPEANCEHEVLLVGLVGSHPMAVRLPGRSPEWTSREERLSWNDQWRLLTQQHSNGQRSRARARINNDSALCQREPKLKQQSNILTALKQISQEIETSTHTKSKADAKREPTLKVYGTDVSKSESAQGKSDLSTSEHSERIR